MKAVSKISFFLETWKSHIKNCHIDMSIIGGGEEKQPINLDNESDSDKDEGESDDDIVEVTKASKTFKNSLFTEKQWGNDEENSLPAGINFKSKLPNFKKSVDALKKLFRKGSVKVIGKIKSYAEEVKRKGTGTEVKINISDPEGEGEVALSFWYSSKKTKEIFRSFRSLSSLEPCICGGNAHGSKQASIQSSIATLSYRTREQDI